MTTEVHLTIMFRMNKSIMHSNIVGKDSMYWKNQWSSSARLTWLSMEILTVLTRQLYEQLSAQRVPEEANLVRWKQTVQ